MYKKLVLTSIILVYLVIIAGATVRMTGSGMGCPDWPKCFGYYIPPTDVETLLFKPNFSYKKGQVLIVEETLQVAKKDFTTTQTYQEADWEPYTKHDYAVFNVAHTWVEYTNRLFGALAGLAVLAMAIVSIRKWKENKKITVLSWIAVFLMGFQGWLGALVVYSVLSPVKITIHMVVALVIVALLLYLYFEVSGKKSMRYKTTSFQSIAVFALILTLIQVIFGTQVRQLVDEQSKLLGMDATGLWLQNPTLIFYVHRTFSILVVVVNGYLWWQNKKMQLGHSTLQWVLVFLFLEVLTGLAMYHFDFPFLSQALHLVIAALLFGVQFYFVLACYNASRKIKSL